MGYQESFVTTREAGKFDELLAFMRELGQEFYEAREASPVAVVTLTRELKVDGRRFPAGTRFIWVVGERHPQRSARLMFGAWEDEEPGEYDVPLNQIPQDVEFFFVDEWPEAVFQCDGKASTGEKFWPETIG